MRVQKYKVVLSAKQRKRLKALSQRDIIYLGSTGSDKFLPES